ncbi:hypothetical protein [Mycolicibacterium frederiksbergense]|uniref:hypothetical protein n=1 Tax=Mycolicibacterium frederiksbergense TaxID=117567 RepID=UPI0027F2A34C|nr:hypothetical protein [Mycolicibacterium frederiksbergense]
MQPESGRRPAVQRALSPLWEEARRRPTHLRPRALPGPFLALAVITWLGAAVMLAFGFMPGLFAPQEYSLFGGELVFDYSPIWPLLCGLAVGSGVATVGYVHTATSTGAPRHHALLAWCAGVGTPIIPILILAIDRSWQAIPAVIAWLAAASLVIVALHVRHRPTGPWWGIVLAGLVAAPWIPLVWANIAFGRALNSFDTADPSELLYLLLDDIGTQTYVPGIALAFVAAMATGGVALAAHSRSALAHSVARRRQGWGHTALLCAVAAIIVVLEVTEIGGISSGFKENYWTPGGPGTWPHAILVAVAIAYGARRSFQSPLLPRGDVRTTLAVGISALASQIVIAVVVVGNLFMLAIAGPTSAGIAPPAGLELAIMWSTLLTLVPVAARRRWCGTVGQFVARVGLLYLLPVYVNLTLSQMGVTVPIAFWAKPTQIVMCLVVIGCLATFLGVSGRAAPLPAELINRLVLIPLLIAVGTAWMPSVLAVPLTPVIAVTAALFALLWAMPPESGTAHTGVVLAVSAQLLLVAAAAGIVTVYKDFSPDDTTLALLLFSVPLSALLCAHVQPAAEYGDPTDTEGTGPPVPR